MHLAFHVVHLVLLLAVCTVLFLSRKRLFGREVDALTPRQYARLNGRLDEFQRDRAEDVARAEARFDKIEQGIQHRHAEDLGFRRSLIETEGIQLRTMQRVNSHVEGLVRKLDWVGEVVLKIPCVEGNGTIRPMPDCPAVKEHE
jgi:hypothetical protein